MSPPLVMFLERSCSGPRTFYEAVCSWNIIVVLPGICGLTGDDTVVPPDNLYRATLGLLRPNGGTVYSSPVAQYLGKELWQEIAGMYVFLRLSPG